MSNQALLFIDAGIRPDSFDQSLGKALTIAANLGQIRTVQSLIENGATVKLNNGRGDDPTGHQEWGLCFSERAMAHKESDLQAFLEGNGKKKQ